MESLDAQWLINGLIGLVMFCLGYILNGVRQSVRDLQREDSALADKVQRIEVLVAGQYVKRSEFSEMCNKLFAKLDAIAEKIDRKADK